MSDYIYIEGCYTLKGNVIEEIKKNLDEIDPIPEKEHTYNQPHNWEFKNEYHDVIYRRTHNLLQGSEGGSVFTISSDKGNTYFWIDGSLRNREFIDIIDISEDLNIILRGLEHIFEERNVDAAIEIHTYNYRSYNQLKYTSGNFYHNAQHILYYKPIRKYSDGNGLLSPLFIYKDAIDDRDHKIYRDSYNRMVQHTSPETSIRAINEAWDLAIKDLETLGVLREVTEDYIRVWKTKKERMKNGA